MERGPWGDYARETAPSFGGLPGPVRARLLRDARSRPHVRIILPGAAA